MNENKPIKDVLADFRLFEKNKIIPFLENEFGTINSAYLLGQGIDQCVDIYSYLVDGKYVIEFDVSTIDSSITKNEIISIEDYVKTIQGKGKAKKNARDNLKAIMDKINN